MKRDHTPFIADIIPLRTKRARRIAFSTVLGFVLLAALEGGLFFFETPHESRAAGTQVIILTGTASTTWTVPLDWNSASNTIEVIGAGGNGDPGTASTNSGGGGGGGEYREATNVTLAPSSTINIHIASGGDGAAASGTWLKNSSGALVIEAMNGGNANGTTPGTGGTGGIGGSVHNNGGAGGSGATGAEGSGAGGGGAAGPSGIGQIGGNGYGGTKTGGGGGGGSNGGSSTAGSAATVSGTSGGNGGDGSPGNALAPGGAGGAQNTENAGNGTDGGGGGGGGASSGSGTGVDGGNGVAQDLWSAGVGPSGGGGGGGGANGTGASRSKNGGTASYGGGGGGAGFSGTHVSSAGAGGQGIIVITYTPATITVAATGSQIATTTVPSSGFYVGGAFTFARSSATGTVSQIVVTETGTLDAHANLSSLILYYQQAATCATSSIPGGAVQFNSTATGFNASEQATATGTMPVGTAQVCVYAEVSVGSGAGSGQTFTLEIANPSTDVTVDSGSVTPATAVVLGGQTTLPTAAFTEQDFQFYKNANAVQPTSSLAAQDASATDIVSGEVARIRLNIAIGGASLPTSTQSFRLQYAPEGSATSCGNVPYINFSDVGAFASTTPWRGYNNASTTDGTTIAGTLLASSTVAGSYVEENPSPANPNLIPVGGIGEWDFVVENNAASSGVAYCFRAVTGADVALAAYANEPLLTTAPAATWMAPEDTPTSTRKNADVRLRVEVSNNGNASDTAAFQLEYATTTAGPWTMVPVDSTCSTTSVAFRECSSPYFANLDPTSAQLTPAAGTFLAGFMLSGSNPAPTLGLDVNDYTELEWNIQATDAAVTGQTYYFRMTDSGAEIGTYSVYPQLNVIAASSTFTQDYYRWYEPINALKPTAAWTSGSSTLGENAPITVNDSPPVNGGAIRLRMDVLVGTEPLATSTQAFKLQYGVLSTSCSAISSWTDVGAAASGTAWRGYGESNAADGTALSTDPPTGGDLLLSVSDRAGVYTDENPSAVNPYRAAINDEVEYDWSLEDNDASSSASYCFRMTKNDGTALDGYNYYPMITTGGFKPASQAWRFYSDVSDETPVTPLAGQGVAPSGVDNGSPVKLRITVKETGGASGSDVKFRLQESTFSDFSSDVADVAEIGSCNASSTWCYASGAGTDNSVITTAVLSDADSCSGGAGNGCGTHNTSGVSSSTFTQAANAATEYEFTIEPEDAPPNTTYFFRLVDAGASSTVPANASSSYPSMVIGGTTLSFTVNGLPANTSVAGVTTTVDASPTGIPFGSLLPSTSTDVIGADSLTVNTNAPNGFQVYAFATQPLMDDEGASIPNISSTNDSPGPWTLGSSTGVFGYHTTDAVLSGADPTRFAADDSYASFTSSSEEIAYSSGPVASDTNDLVYRLQISPSQVAGSYSTDIGYVVAVYF